MYDEVDYHFNWVGLVIKIVIFVVLILIAIGVVSMTISKNKKESNFEKNLNLFREASLNYFEGENLPKEDNGKEKLTLKEMINKGLIVNLVDENGNACDVNKSYAEAVKKSDYYEIVVKLVCGKEENTTVNKIVENKCDTENCTNADNENTDNNIDTNNDNNDNEGNSDADNTVSNKVTYYEYVKVYKKYTPWQINKINGNNVESKKDTLSISSFCKVKDVEYYSTGYVMENSNNSYNYSVKLMDIPSNAIDVKIKGKKYFNNDLSYYENYLSSNNLSMIGGSSKFGIAIPSAYTFRASSLKSDNFVFDVNIGKKVDNRYTANISVNIKNKYNVDPYYASNLNKYVYFVPLYFYGEYVDINDCIKDTNENATSYIGYKIYDTHKEKVTVYRSYTLEKDYSDVKWSTASSLEGYEKTGKTELR